MSNDTRRGIRGARGGRERAGQLAELGLPLEELVRRGARDILQRAIEAEVQVLLDELAAVSLIDEYDDLDDASVRIGLEGNLCRCTGYQNIIGAVLQAAGES